MIERELAEEVGVDGVIDAFAALVPCAISTRPASGGPSSSRTRRWTPSTSCMTHFLGVRDETIWRGVAQDIRSYQRADGSWALYRGAPGDLSTTIECYFALKLAGDIGPAPRARPPLHRRARRHRPRPRVHAHLARAAGRVEVGRPAGDAARARCCCRPARRSASTGSRRGRARTIVPLLILMDERPVRPVPAAVGLAELRVGGAVPLEPRDTIDRAVPRRSTRCSAAISACPGSRCAASARDVAEQWILDHQEADGSWGGIQPPWVYSLMALERARSLRRRRGDPEGPRGHARPLDDPPPRRKPARPGVPLAGLGHRARARRDARVRPRAGDPRSAAPPTGCAKEEVRVPGDWSRLRPRRRAERLVVRVRERSLPRRRRHRAGAPRAPSRGRARRRRRARAPSRGCSRCSAKTAAGPRSTRTTPRDLPALHPVRRLRRDDRSAERRRHRARRRDARRARLRRARTRRSAKALDYLYAQQEPEGSWFGRWGVNHIYGVGRGAAGARRDRRADGRPGGAARRALAGRAPEPRRWLRRGLRVVRRPRGARPRARAPPRRPRWALLALVAADRADSPAARRAAALPGRDPARRRRAGTRRRSPGCGFPGYGVGEERGARIRAGARALRRLHASLPPVPQLLSAARARPLSQGRLRIRPRTGRAI